MALVLKDRVKETSTSTGTGSITLDGAAVGFQSFAAIGDGNSTYYTISVQNGAEWEVGIGTYTASGTTLSRDTVLASSNGGSLVSFSGALKDVFVTVPAVKAQPLASSTAPTNPEEGNTWYNTNDGALYTYYSGAWVDTSSYSNMLPSEVSLEGGNAVGGTVELILDNGNSPFTNYPLQSIFDNGLSGTSSFQNTVEGGVASTAYNVFGSAIDCGVAG